MPFAVFDKFSGCARGIRSRSAIFFKQYPAIRKPLPYVTAHVLYGSASVVEDGLNGRVPG